MSGKCRPSLRRKTLYEKGDKIVNDAPCNNARIPLLYCCPKCSTVISGRDNDITQCFKPRCPMCDTVMEEL